MIPWVIRLKNKFSHRLSKANSWQHPTEPQATNAGDPEKCSQEWGQLTVHPSLEDGE